MSDILEILMLGMHNHASDLHLTPGHPPYMRISGDIVCVQHLGALSSEDIQSMLHAVMSEKQRSEYEEHLELDFAISLNEVRCRVNALHSINGHGAVFRYIPTKVLSLDEIYAPPILKEFCTMKSGMILVTGATGSGKSTTMAAMVDYINRHFSKHILTIEDPIEFVHHNKKSIITHREVGQHTHSFANALKAALREDPDVILVGELRDQETTQLALSAAETGHLVFGTLHTSSASKTIDRVIDIFPGDTQPMIRSMMSVSLRGVIAQSLLKRDDQDGRIAAYEILVGTGAVGNLIRENKIPQLNSLIQVGMRYGMISMRDYIFKLRNDGFISDEVASKHTRTSDDTDYTKEQPANDPPGGDDEESNGGPATLEPSASGAFSF